jgi:hypothetical protein
MLDYIDLSERHGHRRDHGFECGAEFNVKVGRIDIPDSARERFTDGEINEIWSMEADRAREELEARLRRRYKWIGETMFVGRSAGWLAVEDTVCRKRNWNTIAKIVEGSLDDFLAVMESPEFWDMWK